MKLKSLALAAVLAGASMTASANADDMNIDPRFYLGGSAGWHMFDPDTTGNVDVDDDDFAYKGFIGVELNSIFAIEAYYADMGEIDATGNTGGTLNFSGITASFLADNVPLSAEIRSIGIAPVVGYNVTDWFRPFAKLGIHRWDVDVSAGAGTQQVDLETDGVDAFGGVGALFQVHDNVALRTEWEMFDFGGTAGHLFSAGAQFRF